MSRESDYLWDGSGEDAELAGLEQKLGAFAHRAPLREPPSPRPPGRNRRAALVAATVVVVAAAAIIAIVLMRRDRRAGSGGRQVAMASDAGPRMPAEPGFPYDVRNGGQAMCNGMPSGFGLLKVGAWLETPADATADVKVADIGEIQLKP